MWTLLRPFLLLLLLAATPAFAQAPASKLDAILARGTVRVGLPGDYRPFAVLDKSTGHFDGLDVDMADSLGRALGTKSSWCRPPGAGCWPIWRPTSSTSPWAASR